MINNLESGTIEVRIGQVRPTETDRDQLPVNKPRKWSRKLAPNLFCFTGLLSACGSTAGLATPSNEVSYKIVKQGETFDGKQNNTPCDQIILTEISNGFSNSKNIRPGIDVVTEPAVRSTEPRYASTGSQIDTTFQYDPDVKTEVSRISFTEPAKFIYTARKITYNTDFRGQIVKFSIPPETLVIDINCQP